MNKLNLTSLIFFSFIASNAFCKDVLPENNYCSPMIDSKKYISTNFHQNYPKQAHFECTYRCKAGGKINTVIAISKMMISSMDDDALNVVCGTLHGSLGILDKSN